MLEGCKQLIKSGKGIRNKASQIKLKNLWESYLAFTFDQVISLQRNEPKNVNGHMCHVDRVLIHFGHTACVSF